MFKEVVHHVEPRPFVETQDVSFYRKGVSWYVHLPDFLRKGGTEGECLMVAGADDLIEIFSDTGKWVHTTCSLKPIFNKKRKVDFDLLLIRISEDNEGGANYEALFRDYPHPPEDCWLCPVNRYVFNGKHPELIFIKFHNRKH